MVLWLALLLPSAACTPQEEVPLPPAVNPGVPENPEKPDEPENPDDPDTPRPPAGNRVEMTVDGRSFVFVLADNAAAKQFGEMLPLSVAMDDLNGNEKYCYLSRNLPTSASSPGTIRTGDVMLFGTDCLVVFYETFSSSYRYTRIGRVENPSELPSALGSGRVGVRFGFVVDE